MSHLNPLAKFSVVFAGLLMLSSPISGAPNLTDAPASWRIGIASREITPPKVMWMGGFAARTRPAEGTLDPLLCQALVLEAADGHRAVLVTLDLVGTPKWLYDRLCVELGRSHGLRRDQLMFANSHTHSGPVLRAALRDIYPMGDDQVALVAEYSGWLVPRILETVAEALRSRQPCSLKLSGGRAEFAFNRRANNESDLPRLQQDGSPPKGPSDFDVPVLAAWGTNGALRAIVFGYAAHTSVLTQNYLWSADYAGAARRALEKRYAGARAFFFQGCGSDQSAVPRGTVERCEAIGTSLARSVQAALESDTRRLAPRLRTGFDFVRLDFGEQPSRAELEAAALKDDYRARWARRLLREAAGGPSGAELAFASGYPEYPVLAWRLGEDLLWIALGGEVCVDYALRFKKEFGASTWVTGYANDVMAYIPSRRVWEEGGYQAGAFEVYGLPANRWCADIEDRIASAVHRLAGK